jgi:diguanylate cyclase (GGDEF)-like protein
MPELQDLPARNARILATLRDSREPLPSPNAVALELMRLVERRDVGVFEVCRVAKGDPVLVGKAVRLANSALYAGLRPTAALEDAVMRIGVAALARLAVGLSLVHTHGARLGGFELEPYWRRSLARALVLQQLARRRHVLPVSEAFSLGLLAEIGQLGMLAALGGQALGETEAAEAGEDVLDWQRRRWGFDQAEASAALLQTWNFPQRLWLALLPLAQVQTQPQDAQAELAAMVGVARGLAGALDEQRRLQDLPGLCMAALRLGLDEAVLLGLLDQMREDFADLAAVLDMKVSQQHAQQEFQRLRASLGTVAPEDPARAASVLLAGPAPCARTDLHEALRAEGFHVLAEPDLGAGFERARTCLPEAVVLDADHLPIETVELCRQLREHDSARLYLLLLGDSLDADGLLQALRAGANDVLPGGASAEMVAAKLRPGVRVVRMISALERERAQAHGRQRELAALNARLREAAYSDELTGLPNRRALDEFLARAWEHATAHGTALSCVLLDLDHFKLINDTHGHEVGDRVLRAVARTLQRHSRSDDLLARWGGEELVLACPGVPPEVAAGLAERMRAAVQGMQEGLPPVTLSAGVAQAAPGEGDAVAAMLRAADRALLQAKREGRNRIVVAAAGGEPAAAG